MSWPGRLEKQPARMCYDYARRPAFPPNPKDCWICLEPMTYPRQPENIKVCPQCGTNLINTAKRCAVCGHRFTDSEPSPAQPPGGSPAPRRLGLVTLNLPLLIGLVLLIVSLNALIILGLQKRDQTRALVAAGEQTATFIATTYVSPTPSPVPTNTLGPPTRTPVVDIEYTVASGDSCLSIVTRYHIDLGTLLLKNDIDCSLLKIGTVLRIPHPTPTPEPLETGAGTATP